MAPRETFLFAGYIIGLFGLVHSLVNQDWIRAAINAATLVIVITTVFTVLP